MRVSPHLAAYLSKHVYGDEPPTLAKDAEIRFNDPKTGVVRELIVERVVDNPITGYQGAVYRDLNTRELIVAHRGTEFGREARQDGLMADGSMVLARLNPQLPEAMALTRWAVEEARRNPVNGRVPEVSVTGHSLGGTLAQASAFRFGLSGHTFNAYGAVGINGIPADAPSTVVNHVRASDPVSAANRHVGTEVRYATPEDARATTSLTAFLVVGGPAHKIGSFIGPNSALTAAAHARAEQFDTLFDLRRGQIALMRGGATLVGEAHLRQREITGDIGATALEGLGAIADRASRTSGRLQAGWTATVTEGGAMVVRAGTELGALSQQGSARAVGVLALLGGEVAASRQEALAHVARLAEWAVPSWRGVSQHFEQRAEQTRAQSREAAQAVVGHADDRAEATRGLGREAAGAIQRSGQHLAEQQREAGVRVGAAVREPLQSAGHALREVTQRPTGPSYHEPQANVLLSDARHPQHRLYASALHAVDGLSVSRPETPEQRRQLSAALTQQAWHDGLNRIDHVTASRDGQRLFAVQGRLDDPAARLSSVPASAQQRPVEQSTQLLEDDVRTRSAQQAQQQGQAAVAR